jgi:hypothetical protein
MLLNKSSQGTERVSVGIAESIKVLTVKNPYILGR